METITIDEIATYISKYKVIDRDGKPFYGFAEFKMTEGRLGPFIVKQTKKVVGEGTTSLSKGLFYEMDES